MYVYASVCILVYASVCVLYMFTYMCIPPLSFRIWYILNGSSFLSTLGLVIGFARGHSRSTISHTREFPKLRARSVDPQDTVVVLLF